MLQLQGEPAAHIQDPQTTDSSGSCLHCTGQEPSLADGCESSALGPQINTRIAHEPAAPGAHFGSWVSGSKPHDGLAQFVVGTNPVCEVGLQSHGRCFLAQSYPYQCWAGGIPLSCDARLLQGTVFLQQPPFSPQVVFILCNSLGNLCTKLPSGCPECTSTVCVFPKCIRCVH